MGLKPGSAHYSPRAKDGELPVFVNKVLLEHAIYLHIVYDSFQAVIAELSSCHVDHMACKTYNIYYSTIFQKNFATLKKKNQTQGGSLSRTYCHVRKIPKLRCVHSCMLSLQSYPTLCDLMDCSPPGSSVHRILQARILEWIAMPSSRVSSQPKDGTRFSYISCIGRRVLYHSAAWEALN